MSHITYGPDIFFGLPDSTDSATYTFDGFPKGMKLRLRLRNEEFATVVGVERSKGLAIRWAVSIKDNVVRPVFVMGLNSSDNTKH